MLVEITPGVWVVPERVNVVTAIAEKKVGSHTMKPQVMLYAIDQGGVSWEMDTLEVAQAWATKMAQAINAALQGSENTTYRS